MNSTVKKLIKSWLAKRGYKIVFLNQERVAGVDLEADLRLVVRRGSPICLDVGANEGQTVELLHRCFERPVVYAFEPASDTFRHLHAKHHPQGAVCLNYAMGSQIAERELINYEYSSLSSFLELTKEGENLFRDVPVKSREIVQQTTVDWFVQSQSLKIVDLLKIDTQGYDLSVLLGAVESLRRGVIDHVLVELNFIRMYEGQGGALEVHELLGRHGLHLIDYYEKSRHGHTLAWCTALFGRRVPSA